MMPLDKTEMYQLRRYRKEETMTTGAYNDHRKIISDLLAALEAAMPNLERSAREEAVFNTTVLTRKITAEKELVDQARAAIAKARLV